MPVSSILVVHVCGATVGLLSGWMAMVLRKGSGLHRAAGMVFVVSMLAMASCAAYAAFARFHMLNALNSVQTFYLVLTGFLAAKRGTPGTIDKVAAIVELSVGAGMFIRGLRPNEGYPAALYFVFGTIALLHGASDLRMFARGGVAGARRIARHLWRMSLALLFATLSLYPGQPRFFPKELRDTNLLFIPHVILFGMMMFYLARVLPRRDPARVAA